MNKWLLLHSKPHKEEFLSCEVEARKIDCYLPRIRVKPANPRARHLRPYFPGYLFVHIDPASSAVNELRWLPGSTGWVRFGEEMAVVPETILQGIRNHLEGHNQNISNPDHHFHCGDRVQVVEGPFAGLEGVFKSHFSGSERVKVLLRLVHSQQKLVEMPASLLKTKNRS